jgi:hypothetical protein
MYIKSAKYQLWEARWKNNNAYRISCSDAENVEYNAIVASGGELPEGVFPRLDVSGIIRGEYCRFEMDNLTAEERIENILLGQLEQGKALNAIRSGVVFFVVLTVINIVLSIVLLL